MTGREAAERWATRAKEGTGRPVEMTDAHIDALFRPTERMVTLELPSVLWEFIQGGTAPNTAVQLENLIEAVVMRALIYHPQAEEPFINFCATQAEKLADVGIED